MQSIKDHITKPTAMARGRVAHLIEWKGWSAQQSGWELSPAEDEHYCCLPDELREARFAAGEWGSRRERPRAGACPVQPEAGSERTCRMVGGALSGFLSHSSERPMEA